MNLRLISATLIASFLLVSCGSTTDTNISLTNHKGNGFTIDVPKTWTEVEQKSLPIPKAGSIALALTSSDISSGFANNLLILKDAINATGSTSTPMTSKKYATVNYTLTTGKYKEFTKIDEKSVTFSDNDESTLYVFEAKYNIDTPKQKFVQTSKICGNNVYLITIGLGSTVTTTTKYEDLAKTFTCVK